MKKTTPPAPLAATVTPMADILKLSAKEQCARFAERATVQQRAFSEMGKLHHAISATLRKGQTIYGELRKLGVKDSTISNASYAARVWADVIAPGHLTEADFDGFTFADCLAVCRAMGDKSARKLTGEDVATIVRGAPASFDAELESIFVTGQTVEEAEAQAKADADAKAKAEADAKAEAERKVAEKAKAEQDAAVAAALAAQAANPPAPAAQTPPPPAAEGETGSTGDKETSTPPPVSAPPVSQSPSPQVSASSTPPAPTPSNVVPMPPAPAPTAKTTVQECLEMVDLLETGIADLAPEDAEAVFYRIADLQSNLAKRLAEQSAAA